MTVLAGDIGGTKTILALYNRERGLAEPVAQASFPSSQFSNLESVIDAFLAQHPAKVSAAAFGVAGPVLNGVARITNLPWKIDERDLGAHLQTSEVKLLNDLESIANAIPALGTGDYIKLNDVDPAPQGAIGVVAPGTGLGEAFLVATPTGYQAHPSEGGHCDFAPNTEHEIEMLRFLLPVFDGHVSYERVCSGIGIPNIYNFMRWSGIPEMPEIESALKTVTDPTPVIMNNAMSDMPSPRCKATLDMFCSVLAAQAGNLALTVMATGGLYLGGGIPPRILPALQRGAFLQSFLNKGRLRSLIERVPLRVITHSAAGLVGAARVALAL